MSTVTIRASALPDFTDCAARAEAKHLLGLRTPMGASAVLGTALHKSTAVYDRSRIEGQDLTPDDAASAAVDAIHRPQEEVDWSGDMGPKETEQIAMALHGRYCTEIAPRQDYAAVEVTCERLEIVDLGIALTGTTDRIGRTGEDEQGPTLGIRDLKSGKRAVNADGTVDTKGHAFQVGVYELLAEHSSGLPIRGPAKIIGLQVAKTARGQRVAESTPIVGARATLVGDQESPGVLEVVAQMIRSGSFVGNPRSNLCHHKYCPIYTRCKFRR